MNPNAYVLRKALDHLKKASELLKLPAADAPDWAEDVAQTAHSIEMEANEILENKGEMRMETRFVTGMKWEFDGVPFECTKVYKSMPIVEIKSPVGKEEHIVEMWRRDGECVWFFVGKRGYRLYSQEGAV